MATPYPLIPTTYSDKRSIPQTKGFPLIGTLPALLKDPFTFMVQAREQYGDIYRLDLGVANMVVLNHPRHAQHVLLDHAHNYRKGGALWDTLRTLLGNGLVVSEGDFWLRQRRMMQPQFHRKRLAALTDLMASAIDEVLASWEPTAAAATPFDLSTAFNHVTMKVIVRTLFGAALTTREMDEVAEAMSFALDYVMRGVVTSALPAWVPVPGKRRYQQAIATFDEIIYRIIAACRENDGADNHLLAMLLNSVDEETGERMSDEQLRDEVATLFLAGYETTSIALSWAFDYLTQHPEVMRKLQAEVDSVLEGRQPTFADLPRLEYARMVLQESMRLRPPAWFVPRTAVEDDEIDGYAIPAGTEVLSLTYIYHRHPAEWPDPERFDPERFAPERSNDRHKFAWVPFGAGQRMCIGRDFSLMEGQLALAMVMQRYQVSAVAGHIAQPQLTTTLRPKGGIMVKLAKRAQPEVAR